MLQVDNSDLLWDTSRLNDLWQSMCHVTDGVNVRPYRHRLHTYSDCMLGSDVIDWLITNNKASTREQAAVLGQALIDGKWMISASGHDTRFHDNHAVYRPFKLLHLSPSAVSLRDEPSELTSLPRVSDLDDDDDDDGPLWVKEIPQDDKDDKIARANEMTHSASNNELSINNSSVFYVDLPVFAASLQPQQQEPTAAPASCGETQRTPHRNESSLSNSLIHCSVEVGLTPALQHASAPEMDVSEMATEGPAAIGGQMEPLSESDENNELAIREKFHKLHMDHMTTLANQLLKTEGLSTQWANMLISVSRSVSHMVRPDVRIDGDDMDIRQYVIIKTIPGGTPSDTAIVNGLVCTKSVAHRKMRQDIVNPRILLLHSSIEYQRVENKFSSLEPQILQEHEYLRNCVGRIATLQPDILLVEKTVSRLAHGFLLDANITLVLNVKPSVMERVARFTQATIVSSLDGLVKQSMLGSCQRFYMRTHQLSDGRAKSFMYFDGCAKNLGCTVTLRGSSVTAELRSVKKILRFMTYAMYNARLENGFLFDEHAAPPDPESLETAPSACSPTSFCDSEFDVVELPVKLSSKLNSDMNTASIETENEGGSWHRDVTDGGCGVGTQSQHLESEVISEADKTRNTSYIDTNGVDKRDPIQGIDVPGACNVSISGQHDNKDDGDVVTRQREAAFHTALNQTLLTVSPCSQVQLPYLETVAGAWCRLRQHFPAEIYWSRQLNPASTITRSSDTATTPQTDAESVEGVGIMAVNGVTAVPSVMALLPVHPFIVEKLTAPSSSPAVQAILSDYRARGGRLPLPTSSSAVQKEGSGDGQSETTQDSCTASAARDGIHKLPDCLHALNHQRFLVLFSSFSHESANAPLPCVTPW